MHEHKQWHKLGSANVAVAPTENHKKLYVYNFYFQKYTFNFIFVQVSFCIYILKSISMVQFGKHFSDDNIHFK